MRSRVARSLGRCLVASAIVAGAYLTYPLFAGQAPAPSPSGAASPEPPAEIHRPLAVPDRIILTWMGSPAVSQAVTWRTSDDVHAAVGQIAIAEAGPAFARKARTVYGITSPLLSDLGPAHYHSVNFTRLQPETLYAYRVGDGVNWSEWAQFRTASDRPEPFTFVYFGDAQNDIKSLWSRVIRQAYSTDPGVRFFVHAGDLINTANRDQEWGEWHASGGWLNAMVPSIPSPGNHEMARTASGSRVLTRHWRPQFALPTHGPDGLEETVYYIDYQGCRIISLNSNEKQKEQAAWLDRVLSDNPNRWTVITFHHPLLSTARGRDNKELRETWMPVIRRHRVDLVLQGHDHTYARSNLPTGVSGPDRPGGTVFVVSVSGPKMYNLERKDWMQRVAEDTQLYQLIRVEESRIYYEARTALGTLYDAFELRRNGGGNRLIDLTPSDAPERVRVAPPAAG